MDVHASLLPVCYAENVDAPRPDGQGSRQEVPERLQSTLPLDVRVDKSSRCYAFRRQERERELLSRRWHLQGWWKSAGFRIPCAQRGSLTSLVIDPPPHRISHKLWCSQVKIVLFLRSNKIRVLNSCLVQNVLMTWEMNHFLWCHLPIISAECGQSSLISRNDNDSESEASIIAAEWLFKCQGLYLTLPNWPLLLPFALRDWRKNEHSDINFRASRKLSPSSRAEACFTILGAVK